MELAPYSFCNISNVHIWFSNNMDRGYVSGGALADQVFGTCPRKSICSNIYVIHHHV